MKLKQIELAKKELPCESYAHEIGIIWPHPLEMATGKFVSRSSLEIHLKRMRLFERLKGEVAVQHPWREFFGMETAVARIVIGKTTL